MAKPYIIFKMPSGIYYARVQLPDGSQSNNKSTGCRDRTSAERVAMGWVVNNTIPKRINSVNGFKTTGQEKALEKAGTELPHPFEKIGKANNRKISFDKMCRNKWIEIIKNKGFEIEENPKPQNQVGLTLEEFQKREDEKRDTIYEYLADLAEKNLNVLNKISDWEDSIQMTENFEQWLEKNVIIIVMTTIMIEEKKFLKKLSVFLQVKPNR